MAGEKYIVAAGNPHQIAVRNILNPNGYTYIGHCSDAISLVRLVRTQNPDLILVDIELFSGEMRNVLETIDDELICPCILFGGSWSSAVETLLEGTRTISACPGQINRDLLLNTAAMAIIGFKRVADLDKKLKAMTDNYETRKMVDRAKGILMDTEGLSEKEAYEKIRKMSMDTRETLKGTAMRITNCYQKQLPNDRKKY
jgi:AmiR/NasT family two-component response regulator